MTNKKLVFSKIPDSFYKELLDDSGLQGNIYKFGESLIYKEYKNDSFYLPQLELLVGQSSDNIAFPKLLVFERYISSDGFKGYLSDYIKGNSIYNLDGEILINEFINALKCFENEVVNLSKRGIRINDMHQGNLIYTPSNMLVGVDTDMYEVTSDDTIGILRHNFRELGETIISEFDALVKLESYKLNNLVNNCCAYGRLKPSLLLEEFINYFEQRMLEINTINDFKNGVKLIRKK